MQYKSWILFFDKDGYNPCGTEYAHCLPLTPKNAEKRILSKDYCIPSRACSYIILTDAQFFLMDYNAIERYHREHGKVLIK